MASFLRSANIVLLTILLVAKSFAAGAAVSDATDAKISLIHSFSERALIESSFTTIAGTDYPYGGYNGDSIPANTAYLNSPADIVFDTLGNLHFNDRQNHRIRKVDKDTGIITTVVGTGQTDFNGDGILAVYAAVMPRGFTFDVSGDMFFCDIRIRKVSTATGVITTVAGDGNFGYNGENILATTAFLASPRAIALDAQGNIYFTEDYGYRVRKVTRSTGLITTVAGNGEQGSSSSNMNSDVLATSTNISPSHVVIDTSGDLYVIDAYRDRLLKISSSTGMLVNSQYVGAVGAVVLDVTGTLYYTGTTSKIIYKEQADGGFYPIAKDVYSTGIYVDATGSIYVSLTDQNKVLKVDLNAEFPYVAAFPTIRPTSFPNSRPTSPPTSPPTSTWSTNFLAVAGYSTAYGGYDYDNVLATSARLSLPTDIAFDGEGHMHIADFGNVRVRRVDKYTGIITTIAGTGDRGYTGDGSSAVSATFTYVSKIAFDSFGDLFILDNRRIRKITTATGIINAVAGNGEFTYQTGGALAIVSSIGSATHIACDPAGNLFIADTYNQVVWKVERTSGIMTAAFGNREKGVYVMGDYYNLNPTAMTLDAAGDLYLCDRYLRTIMKVTLSTGAITLFAPLFGSGGSMFVDASGNIYYMEITVGQVRKITVSTGITTIVARNQYFSGSICADSSGKIYVAGTERNAVFLVPLVANPQVVTAPTPPPTPSPTQSPTAYPTGVQIGSRSIIAGVDVGVAEGEYNGDGILATTATLRNPIGITFDAQGHLFISDSVNSRIRRVDKSTGIITTVAGAGSWRYSGDGGPATLANMFVPQDIVFDVYGDMYITDSFNQRIRKVTTSTGIISTVVGTGEREYNGENILGTATSIYEPGSIACDSEGNLYYADRLGSRIRKLTRSTGLVNTVAGTGASGANEGNLDNVVALNADISPTSLVIDASGDFYFVSGTSKGFRKLTMSTGIITTIETNDYPDYLFIDRADNIYYSIDDTPNSDNGLYLQGKIFKIARSSGLITMVANNLGIVFGFYVNDSGDIYVSENKRNVIIKISQSEDITTPPTRPPTPPPTLPPTPPPTLPPTPPPTRPPTPPPTLNPTPPPTLPPTPPPTRRPTRKPSLRPHGRRPTKEPLGKPPRRFSGPY